MAFKVVIVLIGCAMILAVYGLKEVQMPKGCKNKDNIICDIKPSGYPQELFDDYVRNKERLAVRNRRYKGQPFQRVYKPSDGNCQTIVTITKPYMIRSNATNKLVVQSNTNIFEQWVKQTECYNNGSPCFDKVFSENDEFYKTNCTPTFTTIKLHVYDPRHERFEHEGFIFPVCCSCSITRK